MAIFNSLGSNYDFRFVLKALFSKDKKAYQEKLKKYLEDRFNGKALVLHKGREAIKLALEQSLLPKGASVAITGFTCWAVYDAVTSAGYKVQYLDLEDRDLNFSKNSLQNIINKSPVHAVIIQNTLGYPCEIEGIEKICKENNIVLIEDLAHSVGTRYKDGREEGTIGDFTVLSFSQDKIVDGISGGAIVVRNKKFQNKIDVNLVGVNWQKQTKGRLYPLLTYLIRKTYKLGFGKVLHKVVRDINLLSNPVDNNSTNNLHTLPGWYCELIALKFSQLEENIKNRTKIAQIYAKNLNSEITSPTLVKNIHKSANLRFPIFVKNRNGLIIYLQKNGVFVSDIWYDAPIAPKRFLKTTNYKNQCPNAEKISEEIINLPTHQNISQAEAERICQKVNQWLKSQ